MTFRCFGGWAGVRFSYQYILSLAGSFEEYSICRRGIAVQGALFGLVYSYSISIHREFVDRKWSLWFKFANSVCSSPKAEGLLPHLAQSLCIAFQSTSLTSPHSFPVVWNRYFICRLVCQKWISTCFLEAVSPEGNFLCGRAFIC